MNVGDLCLSPTATVHEAMTLLNRSAKGIVFMVDDRRKLRGAMTDGDIRRFLLRGGGLDDAVEAAMKGRPLVAPLGTPARTITALMTANQVRQIPVVDDEGRLVDVFFAETGHMSQTMVAVIMAGGEGLRLRPLTEAMPKPMLRVGGRPLLETIVMSLKAAGYERIFINVRYLAEVIESHFGDGGRLGVEIHYLREPKPLGTAGGLSLIPTSLWPESPFLVVNGDLLTKLNFGVFRDFHIAEGYAMTICGRPYEVKVPFGYPVVNGDIVTEWREKPSFTYLVNSGIYCLDPELVEKIPKDESYNMPDLVAQAGKDGLRVGVFPLREPFHEIGRIDSYNAAEKFYKEHFAVDLGSAGASS
ncbi:MAG: nucleotidyltransferase family protein [Betaproteobacteria bacterium]|nr:nucleotidyltransferase family protein [Betaproteobacteria bacterium]